MSFEKYTSTEELQALTDELHTLREGYRIDDWTPTPNIKYTFFYSTHASREDFLGIEKLVQDTDIIIPEVFGWEHNDLIRLRQVAKGKKHALRQRPVLTDGQGNKVDYTTINYLYGDHASIDQILFNSRKQIFIIDAPISHPAVELFGQYEKASTFDMSNFDDPEELMDHFTYAKALEAKLQMIRDQYMLQKLGEVMGGIDIKEPKKVLITVGALHTRLSAVLKECGEDVSRHFTYSPFAFPLRAELTRRFMFGKNVSRDLVAQSILEGIYAIEMYKEAGAEGAIKQARQEFGRFTVEQFRKSFTGE